MYHKIYTLNRITIKLLLVFSIALSSVVSSVTASVKIQTEPANNSSNLNLHLPIITEGSLWEQKQWSGIHLGNISRNSRYEWHPTQFEYIDPQANSLAILPAIIVVQSNQIYEINRGTEEEGCPIINASVRLPKAFQYLRRAAQAGSKVVIRISPSPGSFLAWDTNPFLDRDIFVERPPRSGLQTTWIRDTETGEYEITHDIPDFFNDPHGCAANDYRASHDIADEIQAIYQLNRSFKWAEFGFEPANEPNIEWFRPDTSPNQTRPIAWDMMDYYFYYLMLDISQLQLTNPNFHPRVFTPPMAQSQYETGVWLEFCAKDRFFEDQYGNRLTLPTGYDRMQRSIGASHGFSWHNYWKQGSIYENYTDCNTQTRQGGHHISYHFPESLKTELDSSGKPLIITEADLISPWQLEYELENIGVGNKDTDPETTANSLRTFFRIEHDELKIQYPNNPVYIALWLLNDNIRSLEDSPADEACTRANCSDDHNWHEAYNDNVSELQTFNYSETEVALYGLDGETYAVNSVEVRPWFTQWWNGVERVVDPSNPTGPSVQSANTDSSQ